MSLSISGNLVSISRPFTAVKVSGEHSPEALFGTEQIRARSGTTLATPPAGVVADNDPGNLYATITKGNDVIAKVYKGGAVVHENGLRLSEPLSTEGTGKPLADARIAQLLRATGGVVTYSQSAAELGFANSAAFQTQLLSP